MCLKVPALGEIDTRQINIVQWLVAFGASSIFEENIIEEYTVSGKLNLLRAFHGSCPNAAIEYKQL